MIASGVLEQIMIDFETNTWETFRMEVTYFIGKYKWDNYE
jgi:hypothetical protein